MTSFSLIVLWNFFFCCVEGRYYLSGGFIEVHLEDIPNVRSEDSNASGPGAI